jgi:hypothetical protein
MSDPIDHPPEQHVEPTAPPAVAPAPDRHSWMPWLTGAGFLVLIAAMSYAWRHPDTDATDALARQLGSLEGRVARLEQRPQPQMPDLAPLAARVTALEQRPPQSAAPAASPDLAPLEQRIAALEQRQTPDVAPLEQRITAVERRQPPDLTPLEARIGNLENASRATQSDLTRRLDANEGRIAALDKATRRAPLVQAAAMALAAGQKLGDLPGAPAALARFAHEDPPTEAGLRLAFPAAARQALSAAHPSVDDKPLLTRLWAQAQDLVTIRQGDHVLVGDPVAGVLERARADLDAGGLAAAVSEVATLQGAAAQAMASWLTQARSLLEARAALAAWATAG